MNREPIRKQDYFQKVERVCFKHHNVTPFLSLNPTPSVRLEYFFCLQLCFGDSN